MAKSKIIKELVNEEISLSVALKRIIVLANDIGYVELKQWAEKELNGYNNDDEVPQYRHISSTSFTYDGIVGGRLSVRQTALNLNLLSTETVDKIIKCKVCDSITSVEKNAKISKGELAIDRSYLAGEVFKNSGGYTGVQCTSITQNFAPSQFEAVVQAVSSKALEILMELDKEFGNLDNLDIGCDGHSKKKVEEIKHDIQVIINEDKSVTINGKVNKSQINIGGNNRSNAKSEKKINKNSNVGKGSNSIEKHTDIDSNVTITNQKEKKPSLWSKIFYRRRKNG